MKHFAKFKTFLLPDCLFVVCLCVFSSPLNAQPLKGNSIEIRPLRADAGASTLYTLSFQLAETLDADAVIEVQFPTGFDLSKVNLAGSSTIDGGFLVSVNGQTITARRKGKGQPKNPGEQVDLKFSTVKNSTNPNDDHLITVTLKKKNTNIPVRELKGTFVLSRKQK